MPSFAHGIPMDHKILIDKMIITWFKSKENPAGTGFFSYGVEILTAV